MYSKEGDPGIVRKFLGDLLSQIGNRNVHIFLNGGEPTIAPAFDTIIDFGFQAGWKVYVNTNCSRSMRYWRENVHKIFGVNISYHPEEAPDTIVDKIKFMQDKTNLSVFVLMHPPMWDKSYNMYNTLLGFKDVNLAASRVFKRDIINNMGKEESYFYNEEQEAWLFNHSSISLAENIFKTTGFGETIYENNGEKEIINEVEWVNKRRNSFKGWHCNIGLDYIKIHWSGEIIPATCYTGREKKISTIKEFKSLPKNNLVCQDNLCMCTAEVLVPKSINI